MVLGWGVVALQMVPAKLDQLFAVIHQQTRGLLDDQGGQA